MFKIKFKMFIPTNKNSEFSSNSSKIITCTHTLYPAKILNQTRCVRPPFCLSVESKLELECGN